MSRDVDRAHQNRLYRQRKKQEQIDLAPVQAYQPKARSLHYDNVKSAMAEEAVLAAVVQEPALLDLARDLQGREFSSALLGKVYTQLRQRHDQGLDVSPGVLEELTAEEMSHISGICSRPRGPVNERAFLDCVKTIHQAHQAAGVATSDDLMAIRNKFKESKGIKG